MKPSTNVRIIREIGDGSEYTSPKTPKRIEVRELKKCETLGSVARECQRERGYFKRIMGKFCLVVER